MARPRPAPCPERYSPCARCALAYTPVARWPEGAVCQYCYLAAKRTRGVCASCNHDGVLPGLDPVGARICRACSGISLNLDCVNCGQEAELHSAGRCWSCVLDSQVRALLSPAGDGTVPAALEPLAQAVAGMQRANSGVTWLRSPAVKKLLRALANGTVALEHTALDALPTSRSVEYIRGLLVEQGVLVRRDRRVADFGRWLEARLDTIADSERRQLLERYGRWHHLRRLRAQSATAPVTDAAFQHAKQSVTVAGQFLQWLADAGLSLPDTRQQHIDQWYTEGTGTASHVETILYWAIEQRLLPRELTVPRRSRDSPVALGEQQRLDALRRVLAEDAALPLPLQVRVLAGLVLLFAQPVNRITRLTDADVLSSTAEPGGQPTVQLRLGQHWCPVPEPFASLLHQYLQSQRGPATAANTRSEWLFPGGMPGQALCPSHVTTLLIRAGIPALPTRAETWRQLARQAPPALLAEMLGVSPATAARHAELAGADYARYAAPTDPR